MKPKLRSLQSNLFFSYSLVLISTLFICFIAFYAYFYVSTENKVASNQNNICSSVKNAITQEISKMSTISMNVLYSNIIRTNLRSLTGERQYKGLNRQESIEDLYNIITSIIGPFQTVIQVNLYSLDGVSIGSGFHRYHKSIKLQSQPWYEAVIQRNGDKYIGMPTYMDDVVNIQPQLKNHKFVSLYRTYFNPAYEKEGIVEVIQDCDVLFSFINDLSKNNANLKIYIMDSKGHQMYPYYDNPGAGTYYQTYISEKRLIPASCHTVKGYSEKGEQILTYDKLLDGWNIIVVQDRKTALIDIQYYSGIFLCILAISLLITLLICFLLSRKVLTPLNRLKTATSQVDFNNILENKMIMDMPKEDTVEEIYTLTDAFNKMFIKLNRSSRELLDAKSEEIKAKLMATQSLLKPHFLYNNLANISIMAEENMNDEIVMLCENLCDYLRYITSDSLSNVDIKTEVLATQKYLNCMKIRCGDRLECTFDIPEEMKNIRVSKLILQPIVENSLKYAFHRSSIWRIHVTGYINSNRWYISIRDNGIGFDPQILNDLKVKFQEIRKNKNVESLEIGGMGILNVYLRLVLQYDKDAVMCLENNPDCGACVTLGGIIEMNREEI